MKKSAIKNLVQKINSFFEKCYRNLSSLIKVYGLKKCQYDSLSDKLSESNKNSDYFLSYHYASKALSLIKKKKLNITKEFIFQYYQLVNICVDQKNQKSVIKLLTNLEILLSNSDAQFKNEHIQCITYLAELYVNTIKDLKTGDKYYQLAIKNYEEILDKYKSNEERNSHAEVQEKINILMFLLDFKDSERAIVYFEDLMILFHSNITEYKMVYLKLVIKYFEILEKLGNSEKLFVERLRLKLYFKMFGIENQPYYGVNLFKIYEYYFITNKYEDAQKLLLELLSFEFFQNGFESEVFNKYMTLLYNIIISNSEKNNSVPLLMIRFDKTTPTNERNPTWVITKDGIEKKLSPSFIKFNIDN
jgi:hypothetical protein